MNVVIETERLILRMFTNEDAEFIYQLNQDPEVTRFTLDPMVNIEQAKAVLQNVILPQYALYNHGRWAVHVKPQLEFIGWCGLKTRPELNEIDLGYRLLKMYWGNGYATEAAFGCIKYAFDELRYKRLVGRALPGNIASLKVLEKCGMVYIGEEVIEGLLHKSYEAINPSIP
jgi:ribosomal-protein-alanine N-acetyltransferase